MQLLNLSLDCFILLQLPPQKPDRDPGLFFNPLRGQFVQVGSAFCGVLEVGSLDQAFVYERIEAIIGLAPELNPAFGRATSWHLTGQARKYRPFGPAPAG